MSTRILSLLAASALMTMAAGASAQTALPFDPAQFGISINGASITSTSTDNLGININGETNPLTGALVYIWANESSQILTRLNNFATVVPQPGKSIPDITLNSNVNVSVVTRPTSTSTVYTPVADLSFLAGLTYNPDPFITAPISVLNRTASTQSYTFTLPLTVNPVLTALNSPATQVQSSFTGTLRSDGNGSTDIAPTGSNSAIVFTSITNHGVVGSIDSVTGPVGVGNAQSFAAGLCTGTSSCTYVGQYNPGPLAGTYKTGPVPVGTGITTMTQVTSFTLSAGDRATMIAYSEITPVPEPEGYALMLSGLAALAAWGRRRPGRA